VGEQQVLPGLGHQPWLAGHRPRPVPSLAQNATLSLRVGQTRRRPKQKFSRPGHDPKRPSQARDQPLLPVAGCGSANNSSFLIDLGAGSARPVNAGIRDGRTSGARGTRGRSRPTAADPVSACSPAKRGPSRWRSRAGHRPGPIRQCRPGPLLRPALSIRPSHPRSAAPGSAVPSRSAPAGADRPAARSAFQRQGRRADAASRRPGVQPTSGHDAGPPLPTRHSSVAHWVPQSPGLPVKAGESSSALTIDNPAFCRAFRGRSGTARGCFAVLVVPDLRSAQVPGSPAEFRNVSLIATGLPAGPAQLWTSRR
jgi:hypothetical protein